MFVLPIAFFAIVTFSLLSLRTPIFIRSKRESTSASRKSALPKISIVIPARNEQDRLPGLFESIDSQTFAPYEVIVADDESDDLTSSISNRYGATVVQVSGRPENIKPKANACDQGFNKSNGDVVVFLDADTRLSNNFVEKIAEYFCDEENKVLSIQPFHISKKFLTSTAMFFHLASLVGSGLFSLLKFNAGLFGPCIAMRRDVYMRTKGFANDDVKDSVIEDVELMKVLKSHDIRVERFMGTGLIEYTMYENFSSMCLSWRKNITRGAKSAPAIVTFSIVTLVGSLISIPIILIQGDKSPIAIAYLGISLLILWLLVINVAVRVGNYLLMAIFYPLSLIVFIAVFALSAFDLIFKRDVKWAGRSLSTKRTSNN